MTKDADFKLLKIQSCVLRVNIDCDGCQQKVKKHLQRIEGVYKVNIDSEQQKVTVSGIIESETLIKKLAKTGKHVELWSQKTNQNQNQKASCIKDDNNKKNNKGQKQAMLTNQESLKNKQEFALFCEDDHDDCLEYGDGDYDEEEMQLIRKINQLTMLKQQAEARAKKLGCSNGKMNNNNASANGNGNNNNNSGGKKGNPNQKTGMKANQGGGIDPKIFAASQLQMNNEQLATADGKNENDINAMMNLAGFHGNINIPTHHNNTGFYGNGVSMNNVHPNSAMMMNMNGFNNPAAAASMMMNLQNRQPQQVMYNRSLFGAPNTGVYYNNYGPVPYAYGGGAAHSAAHMFSDEDTSSCSIM